MGTAFPLLPYLPSLYCPVFRMLKGENNLFPVGHKIFSIPLTPKTFGQCYLAMIIKPKERRMIHNLN